MYRWNLKPLTVLMKCNRQYEFLLRTYNNCNIVLFHNYSWCVLNWCSQKNISFCEIDLILGTLLKPTSEPTVERRVEELLLSFLLQPHSVQNCLQSYFWLHCNTHAFRSGVPRILLERRSQVLPRTQETSISPMFRFDNIPSKSQQRICVFSKVRKSPEKSGNLKIQNSLQNSC